MNTSSSMFLLLGFFCLSPAAALLSWGRLLDADTPRDPQHGPHITDCVSREQETFKCSWTVGSFQNLSKPGALRVFFTMQNLQSKELMEWRECPLYSSTHPNECYFSKNYTYVWVPYCVELRSVEHNITYDTVHFSVESIVKPDAPINLNWTLLNISRSGLNFDVMVRWEPPPSVDIELGWISLVYQVQYRQINTSHWDVLDQESGTHQTIYALQTDKTYEVRVRCKMRNYAFGEYSKIITVRVAEVPTKDASFPTTLVMVFGVVGMVILLMLIIFTQQQRLMVILLPPVPAPKIKGIDPELLKKGRLDDLNSILSSQHMYKPEMFQDEPWVEFIELDLDEPGDKADASDTQRLLGGGGSGGGHRGGCLGSSHALSLKDDDSGRASCYDPELPLDAEALLMAALLPTSEPTKAMGVGGCIRGDDPPLTWAQNHTDPPATAMPGPASPTTGDATSSQMLPPTPTPQTPTSCGPNWASMDFYAQVSDVTPAGGVVLSPGVLMAQTTAPEKDDKKKSGDEKGNEEGQGGDKICDEEERKKKKEAEEEMLKFQLLVVNPEGGYATESISRHLSSQAPPGTPGSYTTAPPSPPPAPQETEQPGEYQRDPASCPASPAMPGEYTSPYLLPDANPAMAPSMAPMSDYTVVQDVDSQHSLLLNASTPQSTQTTGKHLPAMPVMPMGYLNPELLGNLMP